MGTSHLICSFHKGRFVVAQYGQLDGYPEGHGYRLLRFISNPSNLDALKAALPHLIIHTDIDTPGMPDASTDVLDYILKTTAEKPLPIATWLRFANEDWCTWTYVVDLDADVLEVYSRETTKAMEPKGQGKLWTEMKKGPKAVDLVAKFPLVALPAGEEFVRTCWGGQGGELKVDGPVRELDNLNRLMAVINGRHASMLAAMDPHEVPEGGQHTRQGLSRSEVRRVSGWETGGRVDHIARMLNAGHLLSGVLQFQ
ncbi:hypothetical protein LTR95_016714, partial [Oleoguttula sp. CCFEE 5521]